MAGRVQAVGTLRAVRGADIAPEVPGVITAIHFQSGQEIESRRAARAAERESDLARLQSLAAAAELAEVNYQRDRKQLEIQAVSPGGGGRRCSEPEEREGAARRAAGAREQELVRAPYAGRIGIRAVDIGQYVTPEPSS